MTVNGNDNESTKKHCCESINDNECDYKNTFSYNTSLHYDSLIHSRISGWDLHCHTTYSDGTKTPQDLIKIAKKLNIEGVAITDHDTTSGWDDFQKAASKENMPVLYGSEITAEDHGISVHMLAYQYNPEDNLVTKMFATTRKRRIDRTRAMVERMSKDYPITWEDVLAQASYGELTTIGRPHIADALVAAGIFETRSQAFAGPISPHGPYYIPTPSPNVYEVIEAVKHAGGVSVIAHPADYSRNSILLSDNQIISYAHSGLNGLEVYHRGNSLTQRQRLLKIAKDYNLLITGGSDWHGDGKPNLLGEEITGRETVNKILKLGYKL